MTLRKDVIGGLIFVALGIAILLGSMQFDLGTARRVGPGYFPLIVGGIMALLGALVAFQAAMAPQTDEEDDEPDEDSASLRPLLFVLGSVLVFSLIVRPLGLFASVVILVLISRMADRESRLPGALLTAVVLAVITSLVFVYGLDIPLNLWPF